jgi:hypothetical protein
MPKTSKGIKAQQAAVKMVRKEEKKDLFIRSNFKLL